MAIFTTELIAKSASALEGDGRFHSLFYTTGRPGAAATPSPGMQGAALTSYLGQIPVPPVTPLTPRISLQRLWAVQSATPDAQAPGTLMLCDRLWHQSGIVVTQTTRQVVGSTPWPLRDGNGKSLGAGVRVGIEVSTATTNAAPNTTMRVEYIDELGIPAVGLVGAAAPMAFPATAVAGTFVSFALVTGAAGVRSVEAVTLGTSLATGAVHLVAYRELAALRVPADSVEAAADLANLAQRIYPGSVPFLIWCPDGTAGLDLHAGVTFVQT